MGESAVESVQSPEYDLLLRMVRAARVEAGIAQRELSRRLGRSSSYVGKIEAGTRRLDVVELFRLLEAVGKNPTGFLIEYSRGML